MQWTIDPRNPNKYENPFLSEMKDQPNPVQNFTSYIRTLKEIINGIKYIIDTIYNKFENTIDSLPGVKTRIVSQVGTSEIAGGTSYYYNMRSLNAYENRHASTYRNL